MDATFESVVIHNKGIILFANSAFSSLLGYSTSELLYKDLYHLVAIEDRERLHQYKRKKDCCLLGVQLVHKNGDSVFADIRGKDIISENHKYRMETIRTIQLANKKTDVSEVQSKILETLPQIVVLFDQKLRVTYMSSAIEDICQREPEDFLHKPFSSFLHPKDRPNFDHYMQVSQNPSDHQFFRIFTKDGNYKHICILTNNDKNAINNGSIIGIVTDVTQEVQASKEREQLQQQLAKAEKLATVGQLMLSVTHELNNCIELINNKLILLQKEVLKLPQPNKAAQYISSIEDKIARMTLYSKNLFQYSRPQEHTRIPLNINNIIKNTVVRYFNEFPQITLDVDNTIPTIIGDPIGLEIVFKNVIFNAVAASDKTFQIICKTKKDQSKVLITIQDHGCGISPEDLKHVFSPFFRGNSKAAGMGLGLFMCKKIIESHDGNIQIESQIDQGTLVSISLP